MTDSGMPADSSRSGAESAGGEPQDARAPRSSGPALDQSVHVDSGSPPRTGDAEVDDALAGLHAVGEAPLGAHIDAATTLHERLQHRLSDVHD